MGSSLGWEDPLEKGMKTHSNILAWRIPIDWGAWWARVHKVAKSWTWLKQLSTHTHTHIYITESLYCTSETNTAFYINCISIKKKKAFKCRKKKEKNQHAWQAAFWPGLPQVTDNQPGNPWPEDAIIFLPALTLLYSISAVSFFEFSANPIRHSTPYHWSVLKKPF